MTAGMDESARFFTREMRASDDPSWVRLREFLDSQEIDVRDAAIGDRFTESDGDFAVLVTRDGRAFAFTFMPGGQGDIRTQIRDTTIENWRELISPNDRYPYQGEIQAANEILGGEARERC